MVSYIDVLLWLFPCMVGVLIIATIAVNKSNEYNKIYKYLLGFAAVFDICTLLVFVIKINLISPEAGALVCMVAGFIFWVSSNVVLLVFAVFVAWVAVY